MRQPRFRFPKPITYSSQVGSRDYVSVGVQTPTYVILAKI